jgi:hypothetical protein
VVDGGAAAPAVPPVVAASAAADDGMVWGKKVEEPLRKYITGKRCRRDVADEHFNNPTRKRKFYTLFTIYILTT